MPNLEKVVDPFPLISPYDMVECVGCGNLVSAVDTEYGDGGWSYCLPCLETDIEVVVCDLCLNIKDTDEVIEFEDGSTCVCTECLTISDLEEDELPWQ